MAFKGVFPATKPQAARSGLLSAGGVDVVRHGDGNLTWVNGPFDFESLSCSFDLLLSDYCSNSADGVILAASDNRVGTGYPFGIVASYLCTGQGLDMDERKARVLSMADAATQKAVERELWTGASALAGGHLDAQYLASASAVDITPAGGALSPEQAVAALEWALGQCGTGGGVIHATRDVASLLPKTVYTDDVSARLYTVLGTPIVPGSGYTGDGPADTVPLAPVPIPAPGAIGEAPSTTSWIYGTGPVSVHLGSVEYIGEKINTADNEVMVLAGRPAAVYWDGCCHFAVQVDLAA